MELERCSYIFLPHSNGSISSADTRYKLPSKFPSFELGDAPETRTFILKKLLIYIYHLLYSLCHAE